MNWKIILVLLIICLGLGGYLYLEMDFEESQGPQKAQVEYMLSFDQNRVQGFRISFLDSLYAMKKRGMQWEMIEPKSWAGTLADSATINHLLRVLAQIPLVRSIPADSVNLSQLYLENPAALFTLYFTGGDSSSLGFGVLNPTTENLYARRNNEDQVLLTRNEIGPMLYVNSLLVRGKQLISMHPFQVRYIAFTSRQGRNVFFNKDLETQEWSVRPAGIISRADKNRIQKTLFLLYKNQVREFLGTDAANEVATGLARPGLRLLVVDEEGDSIEVSFGNPQRGREYLRWVRSSIYPDNLLLVDTRLTDELKVLSPDSIMDLRITDFDRGGLRRIELAYTSETIVLESENDTLWRIIEPEKSLCKLWQVERLLTHADTMQAHRILPPGRERGFENPQLKMTISSDSAVVARVLIGNYRGDSLYMRDDLRGLDFLASAKELEKLSYSLKDLEDVPIQHMVE